MARATTPALASGVPAVQRWRARSKYKHDLNLAQVWQDWYVEGYRQAYNTGYSKLLDTLGDETVLLPDVHLEDCASPGCGATCLCWCHAWEWRP